VPLLIFKLITPIIADGATTFHPMSSRRILYVGNDLALLAHLECELRDCRVVRSPDGFHARAFIKGINYALLLFDEELPDTTGVELAEFSCSLARTACTPFIIVKKGDSFELLVRAIMEVFDA
jgi:DNA-binding response OmpR family regulator